MSKETINAFFLSDKGSAPKIVKLSTEHLLEDVKRLAGFDWADMPSYSIDGHNFVFICNDEGLLVDDPVVTVFGKDIMGATDNSSPAFFHPIRLCGSMAVIHEISCDEEGNDVYDDLTENELAMLKLRIALYQRNDGRVIHALVGVDYPVWEEPEEV